MSDTILKIGQLVTSTFIPDDKSIIRKITHFEPDMKCGSGYRASADPGEPCPLCLRHFTASINNVDSAWFQPADKQLKAFDSRYTG